MKVPFADFKPMHDELKKELKEAAERVGARRVFIEREPKVAAIGAGLDISKPSGNLVIDIGGGTCDIAVLSLNEIVTSSSTGWVEILGCGMVDPILYIKNKYKLLIGERTAEEIKIKIGTVCPDLKNEQLEIKGRDLVTGLPNVITINSEEIQEALSESINKIVFQIKNVLEETPPELSADILDKGIILTGGGSMITGLDKLLSDELKVPVFLADSPLTCVVEGTSILLENINLLEK